MSPKVKKIIIVVTLIFSWLIFSPLAVFASSPKAVADELARDIAFQRQAVNQWSSLHPNLVEASWNFLNRIRLRVLGFSEKDKKLYSETYQTATAFYDLSRASLEAAEASFRRADNAGAKEHYKKSLLRLLYADNFYSAAHSIWYNDLSSAQNTLYGICGVSATVAGASFGGIATVVSGGTVQIGAMALSGNLAVGAPMEAGIKIICNDAFGKSDQNLKDTASAIGGGILTKVLGIFSKPIASTVKILKELPLVSKVIAPTIPETKTSAEMMRDFVRREDLLNSSPDNTDNTGSINQGVSQMQKSQVSPPSVLENDTSTHNAQEQTPPPVVIPTPTPQPQIVAEQEARVSPINVVPPLVSAPVINPQLFLTPTSGQKGTSFIFTGSGFTPNGNVKEIITKPDETQYSPLYHTANSDGGFTKSYDSNTASIFGTYTIYWVDESTGIQSNSVNETITAPPTVAPVSSTPTAPSNSSATALSSSRIALAWQDNASNESGFKIEGKSSGGTYTQINMSGALSGTGSGGYYEDSGLSAGTNYCYRVRAYNSTGDSTYSNEACASTQAAPIVQPTAATGSATAITSNSATLNATVNPNGTATGAFFQWGTSSSFGNTTQSQIIGNGIININVSANLTGLTPATTYYFRIVTTNSSGGTVFGTTQTFTTSQALQVTAPVVNPMLYLSPTSGTKGTKFTFAGIRFTPNGVIQEIITKPDGTQYAPNYLTANADGNRDKFYDSSTASIFGTYTIYWIDESTGRRSNTVYETISSY
ncbi:MAG: hypothetical protein AAB507_01960 [Patescibacteria group bacterium]|mgnify:FL=1